jgi:hypothetical protein
VGIRETLNKNPSITTGVTAGIVILAIGVIVWQLFGGSNPMSGSAEAKQYFSDDDGVTYFADSASKIPPFDHSGKQAVRAQVFQCGDTGKPFVGILQRYTPDAKTKLEQIQGGKAANMAMEDIEITGLEIKKPKTGSWIKQADPRAGSISRVTCPDGKSDQLRSVTPN